MSVGFIGKQQGVFVNCPLNNANTGLVAICICGMTTKCTFCVLLSIVDPTHATNPQQYLVTSAFLRSSLSNGPT